MRRCRRLPLGIRAVLAGVLAVGLIALAAPADAQKRGGTLTIVRPTDPVSLDPHTETTAPGAWVYYNILEPLIYLDEKMTIQPRLATSYEVMSPTKVRFKLRPASSSTTARPSTRRRSSSPSSGRSRAPRPPAGRASRARSPGPRSSTTSPSTSSPRSRTARSSAVHGDAVRVDRVAHRGPEAGRGRAAGARRHRPLQVRGVEDEHPVIIERNPDYWGEKALLDRVVFKVVPEEGARMIALQTGDADMVMFPSPAQLPTFKKDTKYTVHEAPGPPGRVRRA